MISCVFARQFWFNRLQQVRLLLSGMVAGVEQKCLLCDQEETIDHIMISCVFARQFWFNCLQQVRLLLSGMVAGVEQKGARTDQNRA
jgi:hypothetical protein